MSDSETLDYLEPGFDARTLTVPRLRSILVAHDINYPASAKKPQLVELFYEEVAPQAKRILAARAKAKRTSRGIVDVESSQDTETSTSTDHEELLPPARSTRSRSPRKVSGRTTSQEPARGLEPAAPLSPRKRQARSTSRQLAQASDTEVAPEPAEVHRSPRKARRPEAAPAPAPQPPIKLEAPEEEDNNINNMLHQTPMKGSNFSSDNPFQSGSSPPAAVKASAGRRKTTGMESVRTKSASSTRRRTDGPAFLEVPERSISRSFDMPVSRLNNRKRSIAKADVHTLEPSEEFTPEEQLELNQAEAAGDTVVARRKAPKAKRGGFNLTTPLAVLTLSLLATYAGWYRQEKIAVGYCGQGREPKQIIPEGVSLPDWAVPYVEPQCEPCPQHAWCYKNFQVECEPDFILQPHPLSLGGIIPVPPTCEPDGEKVRRVKAVADRAVEELRDRRAKYECGELGSSGAEKPTTPSIEEQELKALINQKRSKKMAKQEFDELWVAAIGEIETRDEVEVQHATSDSATISNTYLSSTSLARVPLGCSIRRSFRLGLARYRGRLAALALLVLGAVYAKSRYSRHVATAARVPALVDLVLERLATQKELALDAAGAGADGTDAFLFLPNLRDDILRQHHSLAQREHIWRKVRAVVEQNSNVRTGQRESSSSGEIGRAWEWIGATTASSAGAGGSSTDRRRSRGRVSWGAEVKEESPAPDMAEKRVNRKWQEGRPIY